MEREVLLLLRRLHAEDGRVTRERLTVVGRGRGLEVARSLMQLKALGLVEVIEHRPPFWRRIFGARTEELLRPVPQPETEMRDAPAPVAEAPLPEGPALAVSMPEAAASQPTAVEAPVFAPPAFAPPAFAPARVEPAAIDAPVSPPATQPVPQILVPQTPVAEAPAEPIPMAAVAVEETPAPALAAPIAFIPAPTLPPAELKPEPLIVTPAPVRPARPAPVPLGYTDELGGAPADFNLAPRLDPALVEGMRDFLSGIGLELTYAGEALAAHRLQKGAGIGDVVMDLVVFALAHSAHHESLSGYAGTPEDLRDYALAILEELARLTEAGEIHREGYAAQKEVILQLADRSADRSGLVARLLADPIGGAAPPALLPEELRGVEDGGDGFLTDR